MSLGPCFWTHFAILEVYIKEFCGFSPARKDQNDSNFDSDISFLSIECKSMRVESNSGINLDKNYQNCEKLKFAIKLTSAERKTSAMHSRAS